MHWPLAPRPGDVRTSPSARLFLLRRPGACGETRQAALASYHVSASWAGSMGPADAPVGFGPLGSVARGSQASGGAARLGRTTRQPLQTLSPLVSAGGKGPDNPSRSPLNQMRLPLVPPLTGCHITMQRQKKAIRNQRKTGAKQKTFSRCHAAQMLEFCRGEEGVEIVVVLAQLQRTDRRSEAVPREVLVCPDPKVLGRDRKATSSPRAYVPFDSNDHTGNL